MLHAHMCTCVCYTSGSVCYASGSGEAVQNMHTTKEEKKEKGEDEGEETIYHRNPIWEDHLREEGKTLVNDSVNNDVRDGVSLSLPNPLASASKEQSDHKVNGCGGGGGG